MKIRKAVITAAGRNQRGIPLQTLVDRDGIEKKAMQIILEEAGARYLNIDGGSTIYAGNAIGCAPGLEPEVRRFLRG